MCDFFLPLALRPTTKVAVWGPSAKRPPSWTRRSRDALRECRVHEGGRLAEGPQTATLVVGTLSFALFYLYEALLLGFSGRKRFAH